MDLARFGGSCSGGRSSGGLADDALWGVVRRLGGELLLARPVGGAMRERLIRS